MSDRNTFPPTLSSIQVCLADIAFLVMGFSLNIKICNLVFKRPLMPYQLYLGKCGAQYIQEINLNPIFLNEIIFEKLKIGNFINCCQVVRECLESVKLQLNAYIQSTCTHVYRVFKLTTNLNHFIMHIR